MAGHSRNKRDSLSDSGGSDIMDLEEGMLLETPLTKKQNCSTRYNNNISNTNVFTVETDVWLLQLSDVPISCFGVIFSQRVGCSTVIQWNQISLVVHL